MIIEKKKQLLEKEYTAVEEKPQDLGIQIEWIIFKPFKKQIPLSSLFFFKIKDHCSLAS